MASPWTEPVTDNSIGTSIPIAVPDPVIVVSRWWRIKVRGSSGDEGVDASFHSPSRGPDGPAHAEANNRVSPTITRCVGGRIDDGSETTLCAVIESDTRAKMLGSHRG